MTRFPRGTPHLIRVPDPPLGTDWSYTLPEGLIYRIVTIFHEALFSGGVSEPYRLEVLNQSGDVIYNASLLPHLVALPQTIGFYAGFKDVVANPDKTVIAGIPRFFLLPGGSKLRSVSPIAGSEKYSNIFIYTEIWEA
jgi:hypothetical protein